MYIQPHLHPHPRIASHYDCSMEELLEGRKAEISLRTGVALSHSFSPRHSDPAPRGARPAPVTQDAWKSWHGNHASGTARDAATATTGVMTCGARSAATISDLFNSAGRVLRDTHDHGDHHHHHQPTDSLRWREATRTRQLDYPAAVAGRNAPAPSPVLTPPPPTRPPPPPPLSAASLRASLRRHGGHRSRSPSPDPSLRPRPHACVSPTPQRLDRSVRDHDDENDHVHGMRPTTRPQPRRAPSEDQRDGRGTPTGNEGGRREGGDGDAGDDRACDCESEWWAGGASGKDRGSGGEQGLGDEPSQGVRADDGSYHQQDKALHVVCL